MIAIPNSLIVQVDTREKYPIPFPAHMEIRNYTSLTRPTRIAVQVEKKSLSVGDYRLKNFPNCCVIERKASILELQKNLFNSKDMKRQAKSFGKLSKIKHPYLLIEITPLQFLTPHKELVPNPESLLHRLSIVAADYGLNILWCGSHSLSSRRALGRVLLHLMVGCVMNEADADKGSSSL